MGTRQSDEVGVQFCASRLPTNYALCGRELGAHKAQPLALAHAAGRPAHMNLCSALSSPQQDTPATYVHNLFYAYDSTQLEWQQSWTSLRTVRITQSPEIPLEQTIPGMELT